MSDEPEHDCPECEHWDEEAAILSHAIAYMNEADERAKERLIFHLVHRYFPEGSFSPKRTTWQDIKLPAEIKP